MTEQPNNGAMTQPNYDDYGGEIKLVQEVKQESCPGCGSVLAFDPEKQALTCGHCGTRVDVAKLMAQERPLDFNVAGNRRWAADTRVFRCGACGAETVFQKTEFAKTCPFCDSTAITTIENLDGVRPDSVIPFRVTQEKAGQLYSAWAKKRLMAPKAFRKEHALESMKALYAPSWTFDSDTLSFYSGTVGDYYYVTVGSGNNRRTERRIRYRKVAGQYKMNFDDILINAGAQPDERSFKKVLPFSLKQAAQYNESFLAGFHAEHYKKDLSEGYNEARGVIDRVVRKSIITSLHCDVVSKLNINTRYSGETFKYLLLPFYICTHMYKHKAYRFFVNGETGSLTGTAPISSPKVAIVVAAVLAVLAGIILFAVLI
ncbi:MAG: hypothetical protein FWE62_01045 [Firmicutes bacterium]|nr:hypothetical protein [Bacillota bacterium]